MPSKNPAPLARLVSRPPQPSSLSIFPCPCSILHFQVLALLPAWVEAVRPLYLAVLPAAGPGVPAFAQYGIRAPARDKYQASHIARWYGPQFRHAVHARAQPPAMRALTVSPMYCKSSSRITMNLAVLRKYRSPSAYLRAR